MPEGDQNGLTLTHVIRDFHTISEYSLIWDWSELKLARRTGITAELCTQEPQPSAVNPSHIILCINGLEIEGFAGYHQFTAAEVV